MEKFPLNGTPVAKHLGVLTLVMKCILLGSFFGACVCVCVCVFVCVCVCVYIYIWSDAYTNLDYLLSPLGMGTNNVKKWHCIYSETWILCYLNICVTLFYDHVLINLGAASVQTALYIPWIYSCASCPLYCLYIQIEHKLTCCLDFKDLRWKSRKQTIFNYNFLPPPLSSCRASYAMYGGVTQFSCWRRSGLGTW